MGVWKKAGATLEKQESKCKVISQLCEQAQQIAWSLQMSLERLPDTTACFNNPCEGRREKNYVALVSPWSKLSHAVSTLLHLRVGLLGLSVDTQETSFLAPREAISMAQVTILRLSLWWKQAIGTPYLFTCSLIGSLLDRILHVSKTPQRLMPQWQQENPGIRGKRYAHQGIRHASK